MLLKIFLDIKYAIACAIGFEDNFISPLVCHEWFSVYFLKLKHLLCTNFIFQPESQGTIIIKKRLLWWFLKWNQFFLINLKN